MTNTPNDREGRQTRNADVIRVLHVVVSLDAGGMERVLIRVARELMPRGFDVFVCGLERRGSLAETFPVPSQVLSLDKPPGRSLSAIWRLNRLMRQVRPDVVHTHNLGPLIYGAAATGFGAFWPVLHGEHCQLLCPERGLPRVAIRRLLYPACKRVHTVSRAARQELIGFGLPQQRLTAVVNGVDATAFAPGDRMAARALLGLPSDGHVVAMVARFEARKRHRLAIEAIARLANDGMNVHLLLAGDGELRADLETLAQATGQTKRVHLLGFRADVAPVYHASDLVVLPSTGEGMSNAILEAMACGTPVLCHDACGCAEVITDGVDGWVRQIESSEALAKILAGILSDRAMLATVGKAARRKVAEHFDFANTVAAYERLYRDIGAGL